MILVYRKPLNELTPAWRKRKIAIEKYQQEHGPKRKAYMEKIHAEIESYTKQQENKTFFGDTTYPFHAFPTEVKQ